MELLTTKEAADFLRLPISSVYKLTCRRQIGFVKIGSLLRFDKTRLEAYVSAHSVQPISAGDVKLRSGQVTIGKGGEADHEAAD